VARLIKSWAVPLALFVAVLVLLLARPASYPGHGLMASYFENRDWQGEPALQIPVRDWNISMDGNRVSSNHTNYSIRFEGYLQVKVPGHYSFKLDSDDGSILMIDARRVVLNSGVHARKRAKGHVNLKAGEHKLIIEYFQSVGESFLKLYFRPPGEKSYSVMPLSMVTVQPKSASLALGVTRAHMTRTIIHAIVALLVLLALFLLVWFRRDPISSFLASPQEPLQRFFGRPLVHDFLCILVCLGFYIHTIADRYGHESYMKGDSPYYANTAISIVHDGDLDQRNQTDVDIFEKPKSSITMYNSNIAKGSAGEWYPKHSFLMPFISVPFYLAFGGIGFVVYNVFSLLVLLVIIRRVAHQFASPGAATIATVLIGLTPLFRNFAYSFCTDILSAALLVGGLGLIFARRGLLAGIVLGLSVWAKLPNAFGVVLAGLLLVILRQWSVLLRYTIGSVASLGVFAGFNWYQYGAPWVTGYQRVWVIRGGVSDVGDHVSSFSFPFWKGVQLQLFGGHHGLVPTATASVLAAPGYYWLFRKNTPVAALILLFSLATFLFYCKYDFVLASSFSNRFLMPVVALAAVPLACLIDGLVRRK
jgi:hypothetical protein